MPVGVSSRINATRTNHGIQVASLTAATAPVAGQRPGPRQSTPLDPGLEGAGDQDRGAQGQEEPADRVSRLGADDREPDHGGRGDAQEQDPGLAAETDQVGMACADEQPVRDQPREQDDGLDRDDRGRDPPCPARIHPRMLTPTHGFRIRDGTEPSSGWARHHEFRAGSDVLSRGWNEAGRMTITSTPPRSTALDGPHAGRRTMVTLAVIYLGFFALLMATRRGP